MLTDGAGGGHTKKRGLLPRYPKPNSFAGHWNLSSSLLFFIILRCKFQQPARVSWHTMKLGSRWILSAALLIHEFC